MYLFYIYIYLYLYKYLFLYILVHQIYKNMCPEEPGRVRSGPRWSKKVIIKKIRKK